MPWSDPTHQLSPYLIGTQLYTATTPHRQTIQMKVTSSSTGVTPAAAAALMVESTTQLALPRDDNGALAILWQVTPSFTSRSHGHIARELCKGRRESLVRLAVEEGVIRLEGRHGDTERR